MTARKQSQHRLQLPPLNTLLGGMTPKAFLRNYWQKKPLLVRQAIPGFGDLIDKEGLLALACRDDAESRLVRQRNGQWQLSHGPFNPSQFRRLPQRDWSVLVQGVNMLVPEADLLLRPFDFIPYARLDDLMVSFAPTGGGVGPHFDSYDVFLIQGIGRRRWEIGTQQDKTLVEEAPLRILKHFQPEETWDLEPGDMLYLPPQYAHNGVALTDCMTWSVGFRAYPAQEMAMEFLNFLQDTLHIDGVYEDPDLKPSRHPGKIPAPMARQFKSMLDKIRWGRRDVDAFLGSYLSEPKPNVYFDPPARPPSPAGFLKSATRRGLTLDPRTRLLYRKDMFYMNGEEIEVSANHQTPLRLLADTRALPPGLEMDEPLALLLHQWLCAGYLALGPGR